MSVKLFENRRIVIGLALASSAVLCLAAIRKATEARDLNAYSIVVTPPGAGWRYEQSVIMSFRYHNLADGCTLSGTTSSTPSGIRLEHQDTGAETYELLEKGGKTQGLQFVRSYPSIWVEGTEFVVQERQSPSQIVLSALGTKGNTVLMAFFRAPGNSKEARRKFDADYPYFTKLMANMTLPAERIGSTWQP